MQSSSLEAQQSVSAEQVPAPAARPDLRFVAAVWLLLTAVTAVPLVVGVYSQTEDSRFVGFADKVPDAATYVARMKLGYDGAWLFRNPYTAEPHEPTLTNTFFLFLGHVCHWTHLPLTAGFHVFRVLFGGVMLWCVAWLAGVCLPSTSHGRAAVGLLAFSSGLGFWVSLFVEQQQPTASLDLWVPEAIGFYSFLVNPLFCLGVGLTALIIGQAHLAARDESPARALAVAGLSFVLCVAHPYEGILLNVLVPLACGCAAGRSSLRSAVRPWVAMVAGTAPVMLHYYLAYHTGPGVEGALAANVTPTPSPVWVVSGLGVLLPLAAAGWVVARHDRLAAPWFLTAWPLVQLLLIYAPFIQFQRKLIQGIQVPLCLLAAVVWVRLWKRPVDGLRPAARLSRCLGLGVLALSLGATNLFVVSRQCARVSSGHRLFRLTADEVDVLQWLGRHTKGQGVALTTRHLGLFTPVVAGNPVVFGHWAETPHAGERQAESQRFFAAETGEEFRWRLLTKFDVSFVIFGAEEHSEVHFRPESSELLRLLHAQGEAAVYAVVRDTVDLPARSTPQLDSAETGDTKEERTP